MVLFLTQVIGKQWHETKSAFRPKAGLSSWEKRSAERVATAAVKAKEKEMKDEKEAERQVWSMDKVKLLRADDVTEEDTGD